MGIINVGVTGIAGRMGQEIASCVLENASMELAGGTERPGHPMIGKDIFKPLGGGGGGRKIAAHLKEIINDVDVVIDFSTPEATMEHFAICRAAGKGIVIGTTGFSADQVKEMDSHRAAIRCVRAPNMSIGVNVLFKVLADTARILGKSYDIEIMEIHHNLKKDSPSGTAMRLAEICARETGRGLDKVGVYGRHGITGERTKDEIAVMALRMGDVVGEHTVYFAGQGERVELTHKAASRRNFAAGAVRAAEWLAGQKNGLYDMQDVLGLK